MGKPSSQGQTALGHVRVLDLSRILAGPWATQLLGDLGAEVVKIETPDSGDDTRGWGPPFIGGTSGDHDAAAYFSACNRNKQSVTIDFSKPEGADLVRRLAAKADVVVENFKVGGLAKYGLDYSNVKKTNPNVIYCSITGFGQTGPYAHRAGYDFLLQGMGGLMSITGHPDGTPGGEPMKVGVAVCDLFTGMYAAVSIITALLNRERTGEGQYIDCALLDSQIAMLANQSANWLVGGMTPSRLGNSHPNVVPYRTYPTRDGHVIVACGNDSQFQRLCLALGCQELAKDARFQTNADRLANRDSLDDLLSKQLSQYNRNDVITLLETAGVPCGPINAVPDVFEDSQVKARGLKIELQRDDGVIIPTVAFPSRLSATPASYRRAPPKLGADTDRVLKSWLGLTTASIAALGGEGVL